MAAVPVNSIDPSHIHMNMPCSFPPPPPPRVPTRSKSSLLDFLKLLVGVLIVLILGSILIILLVFPRTSNAIDLRESNEKIAKFQRETSETIAKLQREQQLLIERERQQRQEDLMKQQLEMEKERLDRQEDLLRQQLEMQNQRLAREENRTEMHRLEDRSLERQRREEDLYRASEQLKRQLEMEEKRLASEAQERAVREKHRAEDMERQSAHLVDDFIESIIDPKNRPDRPILEFRVQSLLRRLDPVQKSLLVHDLYKLELINGENSVYPSLNLPGAILKDIDLDNVDDEPDLVSVRLNYSRLSLPSTNLINASFQNLDINNADFHSSNMLGALFRWSNVRRTNFTRTSLSMSNFRSADLTESNFSSSKIHRGTFSSAILIRVAISDASLESTNFQYTSANEADFSHSELTSTDFQHANLYRARFDHISARTANFYLAKAIQANFTMAYMPNCNFRWTDLTNASFRNAFLAGANFENTNVVNVDFSRAILPGAVITPGQLDVVLSIAGATLPDGSIGKNKNLLQNGNAQCSGVNASIADWSLIENVVVVGNQLGTECVFQSTAGNATFSQMVDIRRYQRLIENGQGKVHVEMEDRTTGGTVSPPIYIMLRFFDEQQYQVGDGVSSLNIPSSTAPPKFTTKFPCPSNASRVLLSVVFQQENAIVDNIYLTIE